MLERCLATQSSSAVATCLAYSWWVVFEMMVQHDYIYIVYIVKHQSYDISIVHYSPFFLAVTLMKHLKFMTTQYYTSISIVNMTIDTSIY